MYSYSTIMAEVKQNTIFGEQSCVLQNRDVYDPKEEAKKFDKYEELIKAIRNTDVLQLKKLKDLGCNVDDIMKDKKKLFKWIIELGNVSVLEEVVSWGVTKTNFITLPPKILNDLMLENNIPMVMYLLKMKALK